MKKCLVLGAGGFIGSYMVKRLKSEGAWVRGVDLKEPDFSKSAADEFVIGDLRDIDFVRRVIQYTGFGQGSKYEISTPEQARQWVRENAKAGSDGIKFFGAAPEIMEAALDENNKLGLGSACHHAQMSVARWNVLHSARAGLTTMEHWYGLPEALFDDRTVQDLSLIHI